MKSLEESTTLVEKLITYRRELHEHPELSMKEYETTRRIRKWLEEAGITILDYGLEVGVVAEITGSDTGPTIALRADIDALPIQEETGLAFSSKNEGIMHACGHDFHTAAMIGAAILLQERRDELKGKVRILFQPAEEIAQGAVLMEKAGALNEVAAIFGMHNKPDLPVGTIGVREGALMASVDRFEIEITGLGGHAGIPNNTIDPIVVAGQLISALQTIVSRNLSSFYHAVISITQVHAGNTWNVIPEKAFMEGTVRTFQNEARQLIPDLMKRTVEGIASSNGAKAELRWHSYMPVVHNAGRFSKVAAGTARILGYEAVEAEPSQAGEDFAFYQTKIPGFFVWMGVDGPKEWHHPAFTLKDEAIKVATDYFTNLAINVLNQWE
ncbi:M20 peptidase aminoacylase family protein [Bacillus tuaregi]|uniref:M20 peptidase aminoacylase family protein n=1 Tax=Bacillus tuaregi TaxID=1816695 RepID=UPI0008F8027D|nr:M20 peptidase aminoacylase family protein [Bacillus tuaregi]